MSPGCVSLIKSAKYSRLGLPTVNACSIYIHIYFNEKHNPWGFEERLLCVIQTIDSPSAPPPLLFTILEAFVWLLFRVVGANALHDERVGDTSGLLLGGSRAAS